MHYGVHDYASVGGQFGAGINLPSINPIINIAPGVDFHWWNLLDDNINADIRSDKVDLYVGLDLGVSLIPTSDITVARFLVDWHWGIHYFPKKNVELVSEIGIGSFARWSIGVATRF